MMKWILAIIMAIHGFIHLVGGIDELGIAKIENLSGKTLFNLSDIARLILGIFWLVAVVLFLVSAFGLLADKQWWKLAALISVALSQVLIVVWWPDAKWGSVLNIAIFLGILLS